MKNSRRIFIIASSLGKGGAERVVSILSNYYSTNNEVFLILLNSGKLEYELDKKIKLVTLNNNTRNDHDSLIVRLRILITSFFKLLSLFFKFRPDYTISFTTTANLWAGAFSYSFRVPFILSERTNLDRTINRSNPILKKLLFYLYHKAKAIVVPSIGLRHNITKNNISGKYLNNIIVINNPLSDFTVGVSGVHHRNFVLAVGRLEYVKGFDRLIEAFKKVSSHIDDLDLIILGEGIERNNLNELITRLDLNERVFLAGNKNNVQDYYQACLMFVLSSRSEGYPNVLIEAMSVGCACIAFDCNYGPSEIIKNNSNGVLIDNGDIEKLADTILLLNQNEGIREGLSIEARHINETNSKNAILACWDLLLD
jgi:glycosyltransferase involved in cell wall biosynthesis